jgi:hypothetical protein
MANGPFSYVRLSIDDLDRDALISRPGAMLGEELYIERSRAYSERSSIRLPSTALAEDRDGRFGACPTKKPFGKWRKHIYFSGSMPEKRCALPQQ